MSKVDRVVEIRTSDPLGEDIEQKAGEYTSPFEIAQDRLAGGKSRLEAAPM
ncbi:MAG: hypothetical protein L0Y68_03540 [Candidatus Dadabacteria bacterium]|nr:hypothetical protein [Candidatus Dadabacteria bacterium]